MADTMSKIYSRIDWQDEPSVASPINAANLNKMDNGINELDNRIVVLDATKAKQSDLYVSLKDVTYDTQTGVFVFTYHDGSSKTVDLNIEKIPVSFRMDEAGVITMVTEDGSTYTADIGAIIVEYDFKNSGTIEFQVRTDENGDKHIKADILEGSIGEDKLQPHYLADITIQANRSEQGATQSAVGSLVSEGYSSGTQNGVPVGPGSLYYQNNAKYYSEQSGSSTLTSLNDVTINAPQDKQALVYDANSGKWINGAGGSGGTDVQWNQIQASGTKIAQITVDGNSTDVYAPNGGASTASEVSYNNSQSGIQATNVQDAIDVQNESLNNKENEIKHFDSMEDYEAHKSEVADGDLFEIDDYDFNDDWELLYGNMVSSSQIVTLDKSMAGHKTLAFVAEFVDGTGSSVVNIPYKYFKNAYGTSGVIICIFDARYFWVKYVDDMHISFGTFDSARFRALYAM